MVGSGILLLPFLLLQTGLYLGIAIFVFFGICNTMLILVIYRVSKELNLNGYDQLCCVGFSAGANLVNGALVFALFGPVVSCFIIIGDMAVSVAGGSTNPNASLIRTGCILGASVLALPVILQKKISALGYVSPVAFVALIIFIIVLLIKTVEDPSPYKEMTSPIVGLELFAMIPCAFLSLCSHLNYYQIRETMKEPEKIVVLYGSSISFAAIIYIFIAFLGLSLYGSSTLSNVLVNVTRTHDNDPLGDVIQYMYLVIPLLTVPILYITQKQFMTELSQNIMKKELSKMRYYVITLMLYVSEIALALLVTDLGIAYALIASTSVCLIVAVLPTYIGMRYCQENKCFYIFFFIFSLCVFFMALIANTMKLFNGTGSKTPATTPTISVNNTTLTNGTYPIQ